MDIKYSLTHLNRNEYISSIEHLKNDKSLKFANMSLAWWDEQFGWYIKGCVVLTNEAKEHLCYIFYKIDKHNEYITIHNIFTPEIMRRHGYAHVLLGMIFHLAILQKVTRFRFTSISKSLDFYLSLGFVYWGVNSVGDFYCDLPMPKNGLEGVALMTQTFTNHELMGKKMETIYKKIQQHSTHLTKEQIVVYDIDVLKLDTSYLQKSFLKMRAELFSYQEVRAF